jgi:hypothetical protein
VLDLVAPPIPLSTQQSLAPAVLDLASPPIIPPTYQGLEPAVLDLAGPRITAGGATVTLLPAVLELVTPTIPLVTQAALRAAVLELRAVLIAQTESRTGTTIDASVGGRLLLGGEVLVEPVPAVPTTPTGATVRVIRRVSETYPNPTLVDGRPT